MTIGFGELRKGLAIDLDGQPFIVVDYERNKMQQRAPVMRIRFRDLKNGRMTERTFSGYDVNFKVAQVERRTADYIYKEDDLYYFMDTTSYEQFPLNEEQIGDALQYLIEQTTVDLVLFEDNPVAIELPAAAVFPHAPRPDCRTGIADRSSNPRRGQPPMNFITVTSPLKLRSCLSASAFTNSPCRRAMAR